MGDRVKNALEDMCFQFAYTVETAEGPALGTGGLSALEEAFDVLGWDDPHFIPEQVCQWGHCLKRATCGTPTKDKGYLRVCGQHYELLSQLSEKT
jgi:hypothetical protein